MKESVREMFVNVKCAAAAAIGKRTFSDVCLNVENEKSADCSSQTAAASSSASVNKPPATDESELFTLNKKSNSLECQSSIWFKFDSGQKCELLTDELSELQSNDSSMDHKSSKTNKSKVFSISSSNSSSENLSISSLYPSEQIDAGQSIDQIEFSMNITQHIRISDSNSIEKPKIIINNNDLTIQRKQTIDREQFENVRIKSIGIKSNENDRSSTVENKPKSSVKHSSVLLRLFESELFDASMAMLYLYRSKEIGVLNYIGNKLFQFEYDEVDFFLPQLVNLYINNTDICDSIHPYFVHRIRHCKGSLSFALTLTWLLNSFCSKANENSHPLMKRKCPGLKLCQMILSEEIWYDKNESIRSNKSTVNSSKRFSELNCSKLLEIQVDQQSGEVTGLNNLNSKNSLVSSGQYLNIKKTHQRSYSETTNVFKSIPIQLQQPHPSNQSLNKVLNQNSKLGDLNSGRAFDNNCLCLNTRNAVINELLRGERTPQFKCTCSAPKLAAENEFIKSMINIAKSLLILPNKELQMQRLIAELQLLNLNLPARVWLPLHENINHLILRVPPQAAILLNSKDKTPFLIYIEVLKVDGDINLATLPTKTNSLRHIRSEENLLNHEHQSNRRNLVNFPNCKLDYTGQQQITINASDIRKRLTNSVKTASSNSLNSDELEDSSVVLNDTKIKQIKETSPFGHLPGWTLLSVIVKNNDDLRREMLAYQLLSTLKKIWQMEKVPLFVRPYKILSLSSDSGLIEPILNTISLSQIKKNTKKTLLEYFIDEFGPTTSEQFLKAQLNFVQSCAAYSIFTYLIQLKDRHNGNILLDTQGHIIHIDFGYIFSSSPRNLGFERSAFKVTTEYLELMGGMDSDMYIYYKLLILKGLLAARKHQEKLISLVEILQSNTQLPCFDLGPSTIKSFKDRFLMSLTEAQLQNHIEQMVYQSENSITTKLYDSFQYYFNDIH